MPRRPLAATGALAAERGATAAAAALLAAGRAAAAPWFRRRTPRPTPSPGPSATEAAPSRAMIANDPGRGTMTMPGRNGTMAPHEQGTPHDRRRSATRPAG